MTLKEKQEIAATARTLIRLLNECDDDDFVSEVADCIMDGEIYPVIDPEYMR